jgi:hypothetical protein
MIRKFILFALAIVVVILSAGLTMLGMGIFSLLFIGAYLLVLVPVLVSLGKKKSMDAFIGRAKNVLDGSIDTLSKAGIVAAKSSGRILAQSVKMAGAVVEGVYKESGGTEGMKRGIEKLGKGTGEVLKIGYHAADEAGKALKSTARYIRKHQNQKNGKKAAKRKMIEDSAGFDYKVLGNDD